MNQEQLSTVDWTRGSDLRTIVGLARSPLSQADGDRQLSYIARYIEKAELHPAQDRSVLIEPHYIDRDFLEDCGAFYVQNLCPPRNACKRLHFFACSARELENRITAAREANRQGDRNTYEIICKKLSDQVYLGFTVIRPLPGCPIGRTVLRCHKRSPTGGSFDRRFRIVRKYTVHVGGVTLKVEGLAFQQQDRAVSACATVAIWCAFHRLRETDETICPSPSRITRLATQYALPFGRSMPAGEGLNISQMCMAVELLQMSPMLTAFTPGDVDACKQAIWSAVNSGYPPILILQRLGFIDERQPESKRFTATTEETAGYHAVTVAGVKARLNGVDGLDPFEKVGSQAGEVRIYRAGQGLNSVYIHDDRIGPYRRADIFDPALAPWYPFVDKNWIQAPAIKIRYKSHTTLPVFECWAIRYLLLPLHPRVRLGVVDLDRFALTLSRESVIPLVSMLSQDPEIGQPQVAGEDLVIDYWIERGHVYQECVLADRHFNIEVARSLCNRVGFPRHVGVLRFTFGNGAHVVDVLLDTTSNVPNEIFLLVNASDTVPALAVAQDLANRLGTEVLE